MDKRTRTWLSIAIALVACAGILMLAVVGGAVYLVASHVERASATDSEAAERFAQARRRFADMRPLLEIRDHGEAVVHRPVEHLERGGAEAPRLTMLRALVYDDREHELNSVSVPFWLIRLMPSGGRYSFRESGVDISADRLDLTVADLERHGPGLVLDHLDSRGARILVWTE